MKALLNLLELIPLIGGLIQWIRTKRIHFLKNKIRRKKAKIKKLKKPKR